MKAKFANLILIVGMLLIPTVSFAQTSKLPCSSLEEIEKHFKAKSVADKAADFATNKLLKEAIKYFFGVSNPAVTAVMQSLNSTVGNSSQYSQFKKHVYDVAEELQKDTPSIAEIDRKLDVLRISTQGVRIEHDFGKDSPCYAIVESIYASIRTEVETYKRNLKKLN